MTPDWQDLLKKDHEITEQVFAALERAFASESGPTTPMLAGMLDYFGTYIDRCHNLKEEGHLFPLIEKRGIPRQGGPLAVMLHEHEEARQLLAQLTPLGRAVLDGDQTKLADLRVAFEAYVGLLKNHFWKENDILYPMALRVMQGQDGADVVKGIEATEAALGADTRARYYSLAAAIIREGELRDLSFGLDREVLALILNALPVELSFVDENDTVRYFSHEHGEKIFGRTRGVIGAKVQNCHPQKSVHLVTQILADFKAGKRDVAEFWIDLGPRKVHIRYWPVRDPSGAYRGCLETVQDVKAIQKLTGQRRLLDPA